MSTRPLNKQIIDKAMIPAVNEFIGNHPVAWDIYLKAAQASQPRDVDSNIRRKRVRREALADLREDHPKEWQIIHDKWVDHFRKELTSGGS